VEHVHGKIDFAQPKPRVEVVVLTACWLAFALDLPIEGVGPRTLTGKSLDSTSGLHCPRGPGPCTRSGPRVPRGLEQACIRSKVSGLPTVCRLNHVYPTWMGHGGGGVFFGGRPVAIRALVRTPQEPLAKYSDDGPKQRLRGSVRQPMANKTCGPRGLLRVEAGHDEQNRRWGGEVFGISGPAAIPRRREPSARLYTSTLQPGGGAWRVTGMQRHREGAAKTA